MKATVTHMKGDNKEAWKYIKQSFEAVVQAMYLDYSSDKLYADFNRSLFGNCHRQTKTCLRDEIGPIVSRSLKLAKKANLIEEGNALIDQLFATYHIVDPFLPSVLSSIRVFERKTIPFPRLFNVYPFLPVLQC
jgi:hypothetical protein